MPGQVHKIPESRGAAGVAAAVINKRRGNGQVPANPGPHHNDVISRIFINSYIFKLNVDRDGILI